MDSCPRHNHRGSHFTVPQETLRHPLVTAASNGRKKGPEILPGPGENQNGVGCLFLFTTHTPHRLRGERSRGDSLSLQSICACNAIGAQTTDPPVKKQQFDFSSSSTHSRFCRLFPDCSCSSALLQVHGGIRTLCRGVSVTTALMEVLFPTISRPGLGLECALFVLYSSLVPSPHAPHLLSLPLSIWTTLRFFHTPGKGIEDGMHEHLSTPSVLTGHPFLFPSVRAQGSLRAPRYHNPARSAYRGVPLLLVSVLLLSLAFLSHLPTPCDPTLYTPVLFLIPPSLAPS